MHRLQFCRHGHEQAVISPKNVLLQNNPNLAAQIKSKENSLIQVGAGRKKSEVQRFLTANKNNGPDTVMYLVVLDSRCTTTRVVYFYHFLEIFVGRFFERKNVGNPLDLRSGTFLCYGLLLQHPIII